LQWAEWQVSVPMMFVINISLQPDKANLTNLDFIIVIASGIAIFTAFSLNFGLPPEYNLVLAILSCSLMFLAITLNLRVSHNQWIEQSKTEVSSGEDESAYLKKGNIFFVSFPVLVTPPLPPSSFH